jgi:uncharacterized cupredoxin-like copper-binding protein
MKNTLLFCLLTLLLCGNAMAQTSKKPVVTSKSPKKTTSSTASTTKKPVSNGARIKFASDKLDFGTIKEDSVVEKVFEFTNVGNADLVVINATGSCGCTIPTYPNTPIRPGDKGSIVVKFTAKNKFGPQKPTVTVTTNASPRLSKLQLDGWVEQIPGGVN